MRLSVKFDKCRPFSDDLGLTTTQKNNLGILLHVLYGNPKVLYAPNGTDADLIIKKAS